MKNPPLSCSYLLSSTWAQMGSGPRSLECQFWSKDLPTHSRLLMWHKAQLKTQKFQLLLPSKQFYVWLPIHSQTSLQSCAELTKGNRKLIVFQLYFFYCEDHEENLFAVKERFNTMLPDFFYWIYTGLAIPTVHSLCVQVLPWCLFASETELNCPQNSKSRSLFPPGWPKSYCFYISFNRLFW